MRDANTNNKKDKGSDYDYSDKVVEINGPKGLEPTRYGKASPEWEVKGRVSDF